MGSIQGDRRLRGKRSVFNDRKGAGKALAMMLEGHRGKGVLVMAIPSGGLPVAAEVARCLDVDLDIIVVRKLQTPMNPEAGFGAISLNGDTILNHELVSDMVLTDEQVERAKENASREGRSRERGPTV
jgi:predicted phosphoribosyltransferase